MTNQPDPIKTDFIHHITPDPEFIKMLMRVVDDATSDLISDFAWQIATDYCDAPQNLDDAAMTAFEDGMVEKVINPLQDRIFNHLLAAFLTV